MSASWQRAQSYSVVKEKEYKSVGRWHTRKLLYAVRIRAKTGASKIRKIPTSPILSHPPSQPRAQRKWQLRLVHQTPTQPLVYSNRISRWRASACVLESGTERSGQPMRSERGGQRTPVPVPRPASA